MLLIIEVKGIKGTFDHLGLNKTYKVFVFK